jgi:dextranase
MVTIQLRVANHSGRRVRSCRLRASFKELGTTVGTAEMQFDLEAAGETHTVLHWQAPSQDFRGYFVDLRLEDAGDKELARATTAVDVSSDWSRFPRYGYLAHFDKGIDTEKWVSELNRFHINGLQFYDVQFKHHLPLAGSVEHPHDEWPDVANRFTSRDSVVNFIRAAHARNMMAMTYNAAYAAYADAFHDGSGVSMEWAAWPTLADPRTESSVKALPLPPGWATPRLLYMNLNEPAWQSYILKRMEDFLQVYPFDGWHIDTYGDREAYAYDDSCINYIAGFPAFVNSARAQLKRRVVLNTVSGWGEDLMAQSQADFVYSELWPGDHPSYAGIVRAAEEIHAVNPRAGIVFAAYLHQPLSSWLKPREHRYFNPPSVLLADATIFAAGASHIELGDGARMLSREYFPADQGMIVPSQLAARLRNYYDFLVSYENYLRDGVEPAPNSVTLEDVDQSYVGKPGTVWTFTRRKGTQEMVHLINLMGIRKDAWRDDAADYPDAPLLPRVQLRIRNPGDIRAAGWASPDVDGGAFHSLEIHRETDATGPYVKVTLPSLHYWDMIVLDSAP